MRLYKIQELNINTLIKITDEVRKVLALDKYIEKHGFCEFKNGKEIIFDIDYKSKFINVDDIHKSYHFTDLENIRDIVIIKMRDDKLNSILNETI